jgi:hypothetical protein
VRPKTMIVSVEAFLTLAWMRVLLRVAPGRALRGVLRADGRGAAVDRRVIDGFNRVAAHTPIAHTCMHRSLALQRMLARRGMPVTLRVGLGRKPNLFPGHAWLERDGAVVNDDAELVARYEPLTLTESALAVAFR